MARLPDLPIPAPANWHRRAAQPVTVEIVTEPRHPQCVASIVLGDDPRTDTPLYSVHGQSGDRLLITHAQLCALALAANALVMSATPTGPLQ